MTETFLNSTDEEIIKDLMNETDNNVVYFENLTRDTVRSYCQDLDVLMESIYKDIVSVDQPPLCALEKAFLELSNCLYYMGDKLERLGVYDVMSKNAYKEVYNSKYLGLTDNVAELKKKPTVAELTAMAENQTIYESVVSEVYSKSYKIVKNKIDAATTMLNSISKIISKRMVEMQLNSVPISATTGRQILNEDVTDADCY